MRQLVFRKSAALLLLGLAGGACSKTEPDRGGLMLGIAQEESLSLSRLDVSLKAEGKSILEASYRVPQEVELPKTIGIVSDGEETSQVTIAIVGWGRDERGGLIPIDRRDSIVTQVPADRTAFLQIVLSSWCSPTVTLEGEDAQSLCPDGLTCDPATGLCTQSISVSARDLPDYQNGDEARVDVLLGPSRDGGKLDASADTSTRVERLEAGPSITASSDDIESTSADTKESDSTLDSSLPTTSDSLATLEAGVTSTSSRDGGGAGTLDGGSCKAMVCDSPAAAYCRDAYTLITFAAVGACDAGQCQYAASETYCAQGCGGGECLAHQSACGNGVDGGESCDWSIRDAGSDAGFDGNTASVCGDGYINLAADEECDPGLDALGSNADWANCNGPGAGNTACRESRCGDGYVHQDECDDVETAVCNGPAAPADVQCQPSVCGDGYVNQSDINETCDNGAANSDVANASCRTDCSARRCGDGIADANFGETCDDGNTNDNDACRNDCTRCGDGHEDSGEECDNGGSNSNAANAACRIDCADRECGDGIVDSSFFETCDDGNSNDGDGCRNNCTRCGDGEVDGVETCDNGAANSNAPNASCRADCSPRSCGDGIADPNFGETCDDGDLENNDACRNDCTRCGDGNRDDIEECDDGNSNDNDGCPNSCTF